MINLVRKLVSARAKPETLSIEELRVKARIRARAAAEASPADHLLVPPHRCPDFMRRAA